MTWASTPPWALRAAQIAALAAVVYLLWRNVDGLDVLALLGTAQPLWLLVAGLLLTVQTIASALRWRMTAAQLGIAIPAPLAIREYYLSQVVNQSLPGGVLGDAARAVRARDQAGLLAAGQAVVFERIAGQIGLLALLGVGCAICAVVADTPEWPWAVVIPSMIGLALVTGGLVGIALRPSVMGRASQAFHDAILDRAVRGRQLRLSLLTAACNIAAFALCAQALGAPLSLATALTLIPLVLFVMVLPLSISGWGLREGAAVVLFPMAGFSAEVGLATSVAFGLVFLITVLPGLIMIRMRPTQPAQPS